MDLSLSFLFCSIDLYFCLCASTILSWWLWLCSRVWSQASWFLQFHSSFSKLLWLFEVFFISILIVKLFVVALWKNTILHIHITFRHKERKFYFDTLSYIRFGIWYNHNRITVRKENRPNFWPGPEGVCHGHTSERIRAMTILAHLLSTSFSRDHPDPGMEPTSPILADSFFTPEPPGNLLNLLKLATYIWVCVQSLSNVQLFATPWSRAHQAPLSMGFSRQERSVLPFPSPGDLPNQGNETASLAAPALAGKFFTTVPPGIPAAHTLCTLTHFTFILEIQKWKQDEFIISSYQSHWDNKCWKLD